MSNNKCTFMLLLSVTMTMITGCGNPVVRTMQPAEEALGTDGDLTSRFHSALYYPDEISLNFPGFVVGIEKSPVNIITQDGDVKTVAVPGAQATASDYKSRLIDKKIMYISHVLKNKGAIYGHGNCSLYNVYDQIKVNDMGPGSIEPCNPSESIETIKLHQVYNKSWDAIKILKKGIQDELNGENKNYTHLLVVSMGWNTDQEEAFRNFRSIVSIIKQAGKDDFNPLFIGVTWPSMWDSSWLDPLFKAASYPVKATDADEVGFSWLGAVIHDSLNNLKNKKPLIVIGHSFGARTTSMATCVGPAITEDGKLIARNRIDLLVSLQGAYSINRFYEDLGIEKIIYPGYCDNAEKVVMTSSFHDKAVDTGFWVPTVGDEGTYEKYCNDKKRDAIGCAHVLESGEVQYGNVGDKHILYLRADDLIYYNAPGTGGGAHSDIYRKKMGAMLWDLITHYIN